MWPKQTANALPLLGIELPIIQSPMAGASGTALAIAVGQAGGLGSLPCAMLSVAKAREQIALYREETQAPLNLNFFCHQASTDNPDEHMRWRDRLAGYYVEHGLDPHMEISAPGRAPFDNAMCELVEEVKPEVLFCDELMNNLLFC